MIHKRTSLRAVHFKCIGTEPQGFDEVWPINVIVGRNNSGKSSLLDLVAAAVSGVGEFGAELGHQGNAPRILIGSELAEDDVRHAFPQSTSGGPPPLARFANHFEYGRQFVGATMTVSLTANAHQREFAGIRAVGSSDESFADARTHAADYLRTLCNQPSRNPFAGMQFRRIAAERNISPEPDTSGSIQIGGDGTGVTNAIQHFLNKSALPRDLVKVTLLGSLNQIFNPDTVFDEIVCRQLADSRWEIFLSEKHKGLIPLSQSGSGLKTVILALCFIHLAPHVEKKPLSEFVMAFEELENNLHPALQRRLLTYLARQAVDASFPIFLTTHSSIAIDLFNRDSNAQVLHVTHDGKQSTCTRVQAFVESSGILDDLDIRASDLLQSNGIIWVEGPSDRVYINHWLHVWTEGQLREGNHYQCVFYGGRLLAHISGEDPEIEKDGVPILRVNRNAFIVIDSDKRDASDTLNATKRRVISEIEAVGGGAWVTDGREIENYIPLDALSAWNKTPGKFTIGGAPFESLFDYLDRQQEGLGKRYFSKKSVLAEGVCAHITKEHLEADPLLARQLTALADRIRSWNRLREPTPVPA